MTSATAALFHGRHADWDGDRRGPVRSILGASLALGAQEAGEEDGTGGSGLRRLEGTAEGRAVEIDPHRLRYR